ncbi:MAG: 50S ribosomal protein L10 [archaeon]
MKPKTQNEIPQVKKQTVAELADLIKHKKTILIASIKNIPASQFQEIGKKLRGKAIVKVPKKNLIFRALDSSENETVKKLKEQIGDSVALLFSDIDSYDLAGELVRNKSPAKAKAGQEAPEDIEVEAGPTDLLPGPAISELGAVGIQIQIEKGKIHIKQNKVIAKKGDKISAAAADIMGKLDIKPFLVGFEPLVAFDIKENKLYLEIKIDPEGTLNELKSAYAKALAFAVEIGNINETTIKFLIGKAASQERRLNKVMSGEPDEPVVETLAVEEKKEEPKETKQEEKAPAAEGLGALFG